MSIGHLCSGTTTFTHAVGFWEHPKNVFPSTNRILNSLLAQELESAPDAIRMGKPLHFHNVFWYGPEAIAAVPARIRKYAISAFGVPIVAGFVPQVYARSPAIEPDVPLKAVHVR